MVCWTREVGEKKSDSGHMTFPKPGNDVNNDGWPEITQHIVVTCFNQIFALCIVLLRLRAMDGCSIKESSLIKLVTMTMQGVIFLVCEMWNENMCRRKKGRTNVHPLGCLNGKWDRPSGNWSWTNVRLVSWWKDENRRDEPVSKNAPREREHAKWKQFLFA